MDILKAKSRWIRLPYGESYTVPRGHKVMILGGMILHITGTLTQARAANAKIDPALELFFPIGRVESASATTYAPLFNTVSMEGQSQWSPILYEEGFRFNLGSGDVTSVLLLNILEIPD